MHGRTRDARYRCAADWDAIGEVAAAVPVPVVGNGDLLFPHEIDARAGARRAAPRVMIGARRADQAVDLPRSDRAATCDHRRRGSRRDLPALRRAGAGALGRRRARRATRRRASSCAGTSASGAATPGGAPTARGRRCSSAKRRRCSARRSSAAGAIGRGHARLRLRPAAGRRADRPRRGARRQQRGRGAGDGG